MPCRVCFFRGGAGAVCCVARYCCVVGSRSHCVNTVKGRGTTASTVLSCRLFHTHLCRVGRRRTQLDTCVGVGGCLSVLVGFFFWVVKGEKKKHGDGGKTWKVNRTCIRSPSIHSGYPIILSYLQRKKRFKDFRSFQKVQRLFEAAAAVESMTNT